MQPKKRGEKRWKNNGKAHSIDRINFAFVKTNRKFIESKQNVQNKRQTEQQQSQQKLHCTKNTNIYIIYIQYINRIEFIDCLHISALCACVCGRLLWKKNLSQLCSKDYEWKIKKNLFGIFYRHHMRSMSWQKKQLGKFERKLVIAFSSKRYDIIDKFLDIYESSKVYLENFEQSFVYYIKRNWPQFKVLLNMNQDKFNIFLSFLFN